MSDKKAEEQSTEIEVMQAEPESGSSPSDDGAEHAPVVVDYDPRKQSRLNRNHLRILTELFGKIAEDFLAEMESKLRMKVTGFVDSPYQDRFEVFIKNLMEPLCLYEVHCKQMNAPFFCLLDPMLVFTMVDRFLGGKGEEINIEPRELTAVEVGISDHIMESLMACFRERWNMFGSLSNLDYTMLSSKSRITPIDDKEIVLQVVLNMETTSELGCVTFCIPFKAVESFLEAIEETDRAEAAEDQEQEAWKNQVENKIVEVEVELPVVLGEAEIAVRDVVNLKVEDVILIDKKVDEPVEMIVGPRSFIRGNIGIFEDRIALKVSDVSSLNVNPTEMESIHG